METIIVNDTVQMFNNERFYLCGKYFQHNGKRLHRTVWEYHNGPIQKGYYVHHIDGNRKNNSIDNLTVMKSNEHASHHMRDENVKAKSRESIKKAIECARKWHCTDEGYKWHSARGKENWKLREMQTYCCSYCGKEFKTKHMYGCNQNHFCNQNCRAAYRRRRIKNES